MRSFSNRDVTVLAFRGTDEHAGFNSDWNYNLKLHDFGKSLKVTSDDPLKALKTAFKTIISGKLRKSNQGLFPGFADYVQNAGFEEWLIEMDQKIKTNQQHKIIITGHSLGAAAAYAAATRFATQKVHLQKNLVAVVPFASPFPGGQPFVKEYNGLGLCSKTVSFVNSLDFIPTVPWGGRSPCEHKVQKLHTFRGSIVHHFLEEDYKPELEVYLQKLGKNDECAFQRPGIF
jgi:predicted lipase